MIRIPKNVSVLLLYALVIVSGNLLVASITFDTETSSISIGNSSAFVVATHIPNCTGKIILQAGGAIKGNTITFNDASFENPSSKARIVGTYTPSATDTIFLLGDGSLFTGIRGNVNQALHVIGDNNRIEGDFDLSGDIMLFDAHTTLTYAKLRPLNKNMKLGGGTVALESDLAFVNGKTLTGSGTLIGNGRRCILGSQDFAWTASVHFQHQLNLDMNSNIALSSTLTFSGDYNVFDGHNNTLDLGGTGNIVIAPRSTLFLSNMTIKNVGQTNISCADDTARIVFQNVVLIQSDNFYFNKGAFEVDGWFDLLGSYTFAYQPLLTSTIRRASVLYCESGLTFSYDPRIARQDLLAFNDESSVLRLNGATLFTTSTGLLLAKGTIEIEAITRFVATTDGNGVGEILLGDGISSSNDLACHILPGSTLSLEQGKLTFQNVANTTMQMDSSNAILRIGRNTTIALKQSLDLDRGIMRIATSASLTKASSSIVLDGSLEFFD